MYIPKKEKNVQRLLNLNDNLDSYLFSLYYSHKF